MSKDAKCEVCGQKPHLCAGTKKERIEYYLDSALRLGATVGVWQKDGDGVVRGAASRAVDLITEDLLERIMSIVEEPQDEPTTCEGE